jgi:hypothetical protein
MMTDRVMNRSKKYKNPILYILWSVVKKNNIAYGWEIINYAYTASDGRFLHYIPLVGAINRRYGGINGANALDNCVKCQMCS